jgi:hypothetical protein
MLVDRVQRQTVAAGRFATIAIKKIAQRRQAQRERAENK